MVRGLSGMTAHMQILVSVVQSVVPIRNNPAAGHSQIGPDMMNAAPSVSPGT